MIINSERLPYILLMFCAAVVCALVALRTYHSRRKVTRAASFTVMAAAASLWMILVTLDTMIYSLAWREILWWVIPFVILSTLTGLLFFSLEFSLRLKRVPKFVLYPTVIATLGVTALSITNPLHHLMWTVTKVDGIDIQVMGPLFPIQLGFTYLLTFASLVLLIRAYFLSHGLLRRQTVLLLVGILIPVLVSIATDVFGWNSLPYIDKPALSIVFTVGLFGIATLQFNSFYLLPMASDVIINNMLDGVLVTDTEGLIILSNLAARQVLAKADAQINGQPVVTILAEWLPEALRAWNDRKAEVQLVVGQADAQYFQLKISPITGNSDDVIGTLLTLNNNTEQKNYEKRLNELAICDPLTGSYNRRYFYEMANTYFHQMRRSARPFVILMIDLDHFKNINDTYGHVRGDLVLQKVAAVCKKQVRSQDIFSRYGGEEFILALPETSLQNGLLVAERLRKSIDALSTELDGLPVTASIGLVETNGEPDLTLDALINRADEAMYASKKSGRNRVTAWTMA